MRRAAVRPPSPAAVTAASLLAAWALAGSSALALTTRHFESAQVHPVEMSPDGTKLFVVHTAGHELAVFDLTGPAPVRIGKVPVGYEPVTVRARSNDEVWVVSQVSDAVNVVDIPTMNVVRTLLPGEEPSDVVFVPSQNRAFVCLSEEDRIAVYDLTNLDAPPASLALTQSDPRALALSPDGSTLYVAALDSQNRTTAVAHEIVRNNGGPPAPNPPMDAGLPAPPDVALIVKHDGAAWRDETGTSWSPFLNYTLLDHDVLEISTSSLAVTAQHRGVGTNLFNLAVSPVTGRVYVSNQEASNEIRFEPVLSGRFVQSRVTTIDPGSGTVTPVHLNSHVNYGNPAGDPAERALSLAFPLDLAVSSTGTEVYVAAMGSRKVGVLDASGSVTRRIDVGEGPTGLALDEARSRLYVLNRFTSTLSVVDLTDDSSVEIALGFDPSSPQILAGRRLLYDGELSSAHGDLACASCHVFGRMDGIAWDLGDPTGSFVNPDSGSGLGGFHPMKGPMATQTLQALGGTEPLHWRGDRDGFQDFNGAFVSLMGRGSQLTGTQMQQFEDFVLSIAFPPNPGRDLDDGYLPAANGGDPVNGESLFTTGGLAAQGSCTFCHALPTGTNGTITPTGGLQEQDIVVPQLRNVYEKTGFDTTAATNVRGFGIFHDGALDNVFDFLTFPIFSFANDNDRRDVEAFLMAFDPGTPAALGAQWTMDGTNEAAGTARVSTLVSRADADVIGLIAKGRDGLGDARGWVYEGAGSWRSDRLAEAPTSLASLLAAAGAGTEITFTAVLKGEELRLGIDRDDDTWLDRDELDAGSDPDDPASTPDSVSVPLPSGPGGRRLWLTGRNPADVESRLGFAVARPGPAQLEVFDVTGRRVQTLVRNPAHRAGIFEHVWDLRDESSRRVSPGVYFVRLTAAGTTGGQRVVVLR
jgi:YVTN family beta-propeller protein